MLSCVVVSALAAYPASTQPWDWGAVEVQPGEESGCPLHTLFRPRAYFPGPPPSETTSLGVWPAARPCGALHGLPRAQPLTVPWSPVPGPQSPILAGPRASRPHDLDSQTWSCQGWRCGRWCHTFVFINLWICDLLHIQHSIYI